MLTEVQKTKELTKVLLQDVIRIHRSPVKNSFTITTQLHQKLMLFHGDAMELGTWQLAVDAFKYPNHFSGSCMDSNEKVGSERSLDRIANAL